MPRKGEYQDLKGMKFNRLTAVEFLRIEKKVGSIWKFKCDCGKEIELPAGRVKFGTTKSCGCIRRESQIDLTGKTFGSWYVVERANTEKGVKWLCKCKCGNLRNIKTFDLLYEKTRNCGCGRAKDLKGKRFGKWLVLKRAENNKKEVRWLCQCDCGTIKTVSSASLKNGTSTNCGCEKFVDLSKMRFGRLVVIERVEPVISSKGEATQMWHCACDCGNEVNVRHSCLQSGHTTSCGCYHKEIVGELNRTHGLANKSHLYSVWKNIKDRCYREKCKSYHNYGGRGIAMCVEWRNDYKAFYDWSIANGYKEEQTPGGVNILSIDRIDNNGNYEPSNCRWVTADVQAQNKRKRGN